MSSPIGLIRDGITAGDWAKVAKGYNLLSGESLRPPQAGGGQAAAALTEIYRLAQEGLGLSGAGPEAAELPEGEDDDDEEDDSPLTPAAPVRKGRAPAPAADAPRRRLCRKGSAADVVKGNQFRDDRKLAAGDTRVDRLLTKGVVPTERNRPGVEYVEVDCDDCGKSCRVRADEAPRPVASEDVDEDDTGFIFRCANCLRKGE
jgi:hypothetical protein